MKRFAELIDRLDESTKTNDKVRFLKQYFDEAPGNDKVWTIALLSGKRPRRTISATFLREWAAELADLPQWLFEESYHVVGDLSETISLLLPPPKKNNVSDKSLTEWVEKLVQAKEDSEQEKKKFITNTWMQLDRTERFVFNKFLTGGFRIGVSKKLMVKALSKHSGQDEDVLSHYIMGDWDPGKMDFDDLVNGVHAGKFSGKPYPFYLAYALDVEPENLGEPTEWMAERKWDGIRGQIVVRESKIYIWSRGEDLVTDKFPELQSMVHTLPDGIVLDGEIIAYKDGNPLSFNVLQTRIGRKTVSKKTLTDAPVSFIAYDILEVNGQDIRATPMMERRKILERLFKEHDHPNLKLSPEVHFTSWKQLAEERAKSREYACEGIMLKRKSSDYKVGRKRGDWWKWKIDPLSVDAVLIYAMRGHGRRSNLYTDYTFAVWDGDDLVPFAKAYSGLTDEEFRQVDAFVKKNTIERFGPVRSVKPQLVFEIHFEGIARSKRHKSGVALRFPRMHRWRKDKPMQEANTLEDLMTLINIQENA